MQILRYISIYGEYIIYFALSILALISIFFNIIFDKKVDKSKKLSYLLKCLPELLLTSETLFPNVGQKTGTQKRFSVLSYIEAFCSKNNLSYDEDYWVAQIEAVLSAPQKKYNKEVSTNETKKDSKKG